MTPEQEREIRELVPSWATSVNVIVPRTYLVALLAALDEARAELALRRQRDEAGCLDEMHLIATRNLPVVEQERDRCKGLLQSAHGALADAGTIPVPGTWDEPIAGAIRMLVAERDILLAEPGNRLDGYRELGAKCAALERERDEARAERDASRLAESRANAAMVTMGAEHCTDLIALRVERDALKAKYHELLYEVVRKYPDETRHQTAQRYIRETEARIMASTPEPERKEQT